MDLNSLFMLLSIIAVFLMIPGLGFFYGGFARSQHSVSTILKSFIVLGPCALLWLFIGDSLVFSGNIAGLIGNLDNVFLKNIISDPNKLLFSFFQLMFSLVAVAIISGAIIERINFSFWLFFAPAWLLLVYYPVAHWVWGSEGWIESLGGKDFAGGLVIHITTGFSAFIFAKNLGRRLDFFKLRRSYNIGLVFLGTTLLWLGWFGFNAGSALKLDNIATLAFINTFVATFSGITAWTLIDYIFTPHRLSAKGINIAIICSLVGITPSAGYVSILSAIIIGAITCIICNVGIRYFHTVIKIDDSNDVFISHGVGGFVGAILTGLFATNSINQVIPLNHTILKANFISSIAVATYSIVATKIIILILSKFIKFRVNKDDEETGLDLTLHGENIIIIRDLN